MHGRFLLHLDGGEIGGGLDEAGDVMTHGDHAVGALAERHDEAIGLVGRDKGLGHVGCLKVEAHVGLYGAEDLLHLRYEMVPLNADLLLESHRDGDDGFRFAGDGIAEVTAVDGRELEVGLGHDTREEPDEDLVSIRTTFVDIVAGVAAAQSRYAQADGEEA